MKKFLIKISYTLLPVWLLAVLGVSYFSIFVCPEITGDIGRLAIIPFGHDYDNELAKHYPSEEMFTTVYDINELKQVQADVITIGDSFSNRSEDAYQNYLEQRGLKVVNCQRKMFYNPVTFAYEIMDLGVIDSVNAPVLVVECGERAFDMFMCEFDPKPDLQKVFAEKKKLQGKSPNQWSLARLRDYIVYHSGFMTPPILEVTLDKDFFSSDEPRRLYFYSEDVEEMRLNDSHKPKIMETYNVLLRKAQDKGIKLVFVVAVDKYDLYQKHIVDNPYPEKCVIEDIRHMFEKDPHILLCKYLLEPMVERGEKDVFLFNDTHWSYKAAEVVADGIYRKIRD